MTAWHRGSGQVSGRMLALAFAAVVGSFVITNLAVQRSSASIGSLAQQIVSNSAPSIEHLAVVRRTALEAELALAGLVHEPGTHAETGPALDLALSRLRASARAYLSLPPLAGEQTLRLDVQENWLRFDQAVRRGRALADSGASREAAAMIARDVEPARRQLLDDVTRTIELNAAHGRELAEAIRRTRQTTSALALGLNALCGVLAVTMAWLLFRQLRARRTLLEAHLDLVEERAAEMERFSGRVAHDIRNPLTAARLAAELAARKSTEEPVRELVQRVVRGLSRADAITTGLLDFARAGAQPDPHARTEARAVVADVIAGMAPEASRGGIELTAEPVPPVAVACSEGVYLSLVGNLVRNAMKYMGEVPTRRITIRVISAGPLARTEVVDTGPGIAPADLPSLFEPYFRVRAGGADGLGLGLATVKKLAESHGGHVGVRSELERGSTFWFDLPQAPEIAERGDDEGDLAPPAARERASAAGGSRDVRPASSHRPYAPRE